MDATEATEATDATEATEATDATDATEERCAEPYGYRISITQTQKTETEEGKGKDAKKGSISIEPLSHALEARRFGLMLIFGFGI